MSNDEKIPKVFQPEDDPTLFVLGTGAMAIIAWLLSAIPLENVLNQAPTGDIDTSELMLLMAAILASAALSLAALGIGITVALRNHQKQMAWETVKELRQTQH